MYRFDCRFCDSILQTGSVDSVKSRSKTHLTESHDDDVLAVLRDRYDDVSCHNDCGYVVSITGADVAGLDCPRCGHDNFSPLVEQYVYWRIEAQ